MKGLGGWSIEGVDADLFFLFTGRLILYDAVDLGEEGVIASEPDVRAGKDPRSPLSHQDAARSNRLAVKPLDAQPLTCAIPPVSGASPCFFVGHAFLLELR